MAWNKYINILKQRLKLSLLKNQNFKKEKKFNGDSRRENMKQFYKAKYITIQPYKLSTNIENSRESQFSKSSC